jgi:sialic acid synthase SpsE
VAAEAGADSVKFQIIYPEGLYLPQFFAAGSYSENQAFQQRVAQMLADDDYRALAAQARERGIGFSASVFDERGIALLDDLDAPYIKIASCDLNNSPLLERAAACGRRLVISTGMASLGEIDRAVSDVVKAGQSDIVLMHCVSVYPCPTERMNLGFLDVLRQAFGFPIGLSDHTEQSLAAAIAVSKGVTWIEKHYTLDRTAEGFDHHYAMEPDALARYIADIRASTAACQPQLVKVGAAEASVKQRARRGLYAARDIAAGETLSAADLLIVRPEGPLGPNDSTYVIGRTARRALHQYEAISLDSVA